MRRPKRCANAARYNLAGISFTPREIAAAIRRRLPDFTMDIEPDFRQAIAASWPRSIDDRAARATGAGGRATTCRRWSTTCSTTCARC